MSFLSQIFATPSDNAVDAFGNQRVSSAVTLSENSFEYDLNPLFFEVITTNGATVAWDANKRSAILTVSTPADVNGTGTVEITGTSNPRTATFSSSQTLATNQIFRVGDFWYRVVSGGTKTVFSVDGESTQTAGSSFVILGSRAVLRQIQRNLYEKGKSQFIKITFLSGAGVSTLVRQAGYYSQSNGVYFKQSSTLNFVLRSSVSGAIVETTVSQSSWNIDKLNGSGLSGKTLDMTKQQILVFDAQFLGAGRVRCGFVIDGKLIWAHEFLNSNVTDTAPYMQTFTLPVTYEIYNSATSAGSNTLQAICCEVESERGGDSPPNAHHFTAFNTSDVSAGTSRTHLISIRPKQTFNGRTNRMIIVPEDVLGVVGSNPCTVEVIYNSTLTGGSWVSASSNSGVEYNLGASISATGETVSSFPIPASGGGSRNEGGHQLSTLLPLVLDSFGANPKVLTIAVTSYTATSNSRMYINWKEYR